MTARRRNDCYGRYEYIMLDDRDGTYFLWCGHWSSGLGDDTLEVVDDPLAAIEAAGYHLSDKDVAAIEKISK